MALFDELKIIILSLHLIMSIYDIIIIWKNSNTIQ